MIKSCLYTMCVLFVYCFSTVNAQASAISSPVAATDSTGISDRFDIGNTIDQSGLSVGFVSGVTDFDAYLAGNPTHVIYSLDNEWFTNRPDISATIIYDLGGVFSVDRLALWNEESAGIGFFDISTSLDNAIFTPVASGLIPVDNPLDTNYGAEVFDFRTQVARYIQLDVGGCPQPDGFDHENCGIGEVAFSTSPIPIPLQPRILNVNPNPVLGSNLPQAFTIIGENFLDGASVTLRDLSTEDVFPDRTISHFSVDSIVINPRFTTTEARWSVEIINPDGTSSNSFEFNVEPLSIMAPVLGKFRVTGIEDTDCGWIPELWTFCQNQTGFHRVGGGISGSNDLFAWDMNLSNYSDKNKPVFAVASGTIVKYAGAVDPGAVSGAVLVQHETNGITWWSGYLHMTDIPKNISVGQKVTTSTRLGRISNICDGCDGKPIPDHLHFVIYDGNNTPGELISRDANFIERVLSPTPTDLGGTIKTFDGTDICALVLASGQFMFSCNPTGVMSLTGLPSESDGTVKRQIYADGFSPRIDALSGSSDDAVVMTRSGTCPDYNTPYDPGFVPGSAGKRINIEGKVLLQDSQTPTCALALANGQHKFSCDGTGSYSLNIPLDSNGQFKLQVYADGFAPTIQTFDEFQVNNNVRMARVAECQ